MKKLLTILGALAISASSSSVVIACGSSSDSSKKLFDNIDWGNDSEKIISLPDGTTITVGQLTKSNKSELDNYILNDVNRLVANKYAQDYNDTTINGKSNLGLVSDNQSYVVQGDKNFNAYSDEIDNFSDISVASDLYRSYVSSLSGTPLDEKYSKESFGQLNPIYYGNTYHLYGRYSLWFTADEGKTYTRWTTGSETTAADNVKDPFYKDVITDKKFLPTAELLNGNNFILVDGEKEPGKKIISTGYAADPITDEESLTKSVDDLKDNIVANNLSGYKALLLRFQKQIQSSEKSPMQNAFVMEYAKNNLYKLQSAPVKGGTEFEVANNKSLYVDTSSTIASDIQSWPSSSNELVTSKYKMVWNVALPIDTAQTIQDEINNNQINKSPINSNLKLTNYQLVKNDAKTFMDAIIKASGAGKNNSNNGTDPYFGLSGYQGITKDGKLVDGGTLNIDDSAVDKIKDVEGLGILYNGVNAGDAKQYAFADKDQPSKLQDYILVMPLYLMDLLRSGTDAAPAVADDNSDSNKLVNIATNRWIQLQPQSADATWSSTSDFTAGNGVKSIKPEDIKDPSQLPAETSIMKAADGKTYIFIANADAGKDLSVTTDKTTVSIKAANPSDDKSGYGVKGVYFTDDKSTDERKTAWKYNGQEINYAIHLGTGRNTPNNIEDAWTSKDFDGEPIKDVANLTNEKKTDIVNTLFAYAAKDDSNLQEETKNNIYRNYLSLDDIHYKAIYDDLSKYLKEDDSTDDSD